MTCRNEIFVSLAIIVCGVVACGAEQKTIVVDITPDMGLVAARDSVRDLRKKGRTGLVVVRLGAGRYELARPLELDGRDSNVIWGAKRGTDVRISGGRLVRTIPERVTDEGLLSRILGKARGKVVQFDLTEIAVDDWGDYLYNYEDAMQQRVAKTWNEGEFTMGSHPPPNGTTSAGRMELFVDDRPMTLARMPNGVFYHVDTLLGRIEHQGPGDGYDCSAVGRFTCREELPAAWEREPDVHVCGCWCHDWAEQHQRVVYFDRIKRELGLSEPYHQYMYRSGSYFYGFNLLCELDEPGEWYVDRRTRRLLAWLPERKGGAQRIELSMSGRIVEMEGATNVVFHGVVFEASRNSAVRMKDSERCLLDDCVVRNVGQHALIVEDGHSCGARNCHFSGMGGGGAFLVDNNRVSLEPSGHFVEDCDMHDFGRWNRMYRPGVCLSGVGMRAVRNRIHDAPHAAILFFGCELLIQSNEIYRVNRETRDCGSIYSGRSWLLRGNRILDNYLHDIVGLDGAYTRTIYLDDSTSDTLIAGNRFERCMWAVFVGGARDNVITNNVFVDCPCALHVDARGRDWQKPHIDRRIKEMLENGTLYGVPYGTGPYAEKYPALRELPGPDPYSPVGNRIENNVFDRGKGEWIARYGGKRVKNPEEWWHDGLSVEELAELGTFRKNVVDCKAIETDQHKNVEPKP